MKRLLILFSVLILLFSSSSCRFSNDDNILRYDIGSDPGTLDPQASNDYAGKMVLSHVMEGLVTKNSSEKIETACAESYSISDDELIYTFTLKEDLFWSNGSKISADDFVFAITRLFLPETSAPDISRYMCIKNAHEVYSGELPVSDLGIRSVDENALVIELSYKNSGFLETLASVSSLPCNRDFFENSKGKYGSNERYLIYNSHFKISDWEKGNYIALRPNTKYYDQTSVKSAGINFYTADDLDHAARLLEGKTEISLISPEAAQSLDLKKFETTEFYCTTWMIGFNHQKDIFKNQNLRAALMASAQNTSFSPDGKSEFIAANRIIPPTVKADYSISDLSTTDPPHLLYSKALNELGIRSLPAISIICPDYYDFKLYLTYLQKTWLNDLGVAINFEVLNSADFSDALGSGNFDIILFPITADSESALNVLSCFETLSASG